MVTTYRVESGICVKDISMVEDSVKKAGSQVVLMPDAPSV